MCGAGEKKRPAEAGSAGKCDHAHGRNPVPRLEFEPYSRTARRMATRTSPPSPAASTPPAPAPGATTEHIYIGSDDSNAEPKAAARTPTDTVVLRNPIRRTGAELTLFDEGYLKVTPLANGNADAPFYLDLRFVDPVPKIERVVAKRWLTAALAGAALTALAGFLLRFDALYPFSVWALGATSLATVVALYVGVYSSHEKIEFYTLHGRAPVLELIANIGSIKKYRAFVPQLSRSIEEAAERIGADTAAYLRAEMREHYRLRRDGVLDQNECAHGTGRILAQFDVQL